jgi:hypothetical protein
MKNLLKIYIGLIFSLIVVLVGFVITYDNIKKPGNYFKIGKSNGSNVFLRATPEYEYQLYIEDDMIVIESFGRFVDTIHLDSAGKVGKVLIKDNE